MRNLFKRLWQCQPIGNEYSMMCQCYWSDSYTWSGCLTPLCFYLSRWVTAQLGSCRSLLGHVNILLHTILHQNYMGWSACLGSHSLAMEFWENMSGDVWNLQFSLLNYFATSLRGYWAGTNVASTRDAGAEQEISTTKTCRC